MLNKIYEKIKKFIFLNYKFLLFWLIIIFVFTYKLPYVIYKTGGTINLNNRIDITDKKIKGSFNMAYVSVVNGTIPAIALSYVIPNWDLEKRSNITLENQSIKDLIKMEKLEMRSSIDVATILAYQKANKNINVKNEKLIISYIAKNAHTNLKLDDQIMKVDGKVVNDIKEINEYFNQLKENTEITILVKRNGKIINTKSYLQKIDDTLKIGITFIKTYDYETKPNFKLKPKGSESGSSGGLMLSLAIYNELIEQDLTKGKKIVGTGTININGEVGKIDGIKYKLLGSKNADIFICPKENYQEAINIKKKYKLKIKILGVSTFDEAVSYLNNK